MCHEAPASRGFNSKGCPDWADAAFDDFLAVYTFTTADAAAAAASELEAVGMVPAFPAPATVPVQPPAPFFELADSLDLLDFLAAPAEVPVYALHPQEQALLIASDAPPTVPSLDLDGILSFEELAALACGPFAAEGMAQAPPSDEPLAKRARGRPRQQQQQSRQQSLTPAQEQLLCAVAAEPVRKRKPKVAVPPELRDAKYYQQRQLNTERAALSRQRRRLEESQQKTHLAQLHTQRAVLQDEVALLHAELEALRVAALAKLQCAA